MSADKPATMQILVAWRDTRWVVLQDTIEIGAYAYRSHAMEMAKVLSARAQADGLECYMLIREQDGHWEEHPCPKP